MNSFALKQHLIVLALLWLAASCIDYQERIVVNRDGSVELTVYATIVNAALPMVKNRPELKQLLLLPVNPDGAKKLLPQAIKIKHWQVVDGPGIRIVDATVSVDNIETLQAHLGVFASSQHFKLYRNNQGNYRYEREVPAYPINANNSLSRPLLEKQLTNSNLEFSLSVPTRIISSNGQYINQQSVRWQTNLIQLRQEGFRMYAEIAAPSQATWLIPLGAGMVLVISGGMVFWLIQKRRRTVHRLE